MRVDIGDKITFSNILHDSTNREIDAKLLNGITIDSRRVKKGDIFIALKGENFDGHDFIDDCLEKGALLIINENYENKNIIKVKSSKLIIKKLAMLYRESMECKVIGITGSNGKTTTKEILSHVLSSIYNISCTKNNFNSTVGLPISIFSISDSDEIFLAEMGTNQKGEIKFLCEVAQPDFGIITNIAEAHIANFDSLDEIYNEKINLFKSISKDGTIFINMDDLLLSSSRSLFNCQSIEFGFWGNYNYNGRSCDFKNNKMIINDLSIDIPYLTNHLAKNILSSFSIAFELGASSSIFKKRLKTFNLPDGRGNIINTDEYTIINDTYNSNYSSTISGIESLKKFPSCRKILVLADMLELGDKSIGYHVNLLDHFIENDISHVFIYGQLMYNLYEHTSKKSDINIFYFDKQDELIKQLNAYIKKNDIIYIKGSRSMKMENVIKGIC